MLSSRSTSNRRNASSIWNVMSKTGPGLAQCSLCGQEFKSNKGTSNMLRHVRTKHMTALEEYEHTENSGEKDIHEDLASDYTIEVLPNTSTSNRKNASSIWRMMSKIGPGLARCNVCGQEFKSNKGTSNLLRHLRSKHTAVGELTENNGVYPSGQDGSPTPGNQPAVEQVSGQQTIDSSLTKYGPKSKKKKVLDQKLLKMVYKDLQPFSIVDDSGFQDFCKEMDPRYEIPSRQQLKKSLVTAFTEEKKRLIETLSDVDSVAITTDSWTSVNMESFLTITAHFLEPSPSWELHAIVLATRMLDEEDQGSSAEAVADFISEVLDEFKIKEKLVSVTTDDASSMVSLVKNQPKVLHVSCFANTLNLIVKNSLEASFELGTLVEAVKSIVNFFHKNAEATAELKSTTGISDLGLTLMKKHEPCQDVETRWNSTLNMLRQYTELHRAVSAVLMAQGKTDLIISDDNMENMEKICECLEPFEEATEMMLTEKRTSMSKILMIVRQLQYFLKNEATKCELTDILIRRISERFPNPEENFSDAAAILLDPRFKQVPFNNDKYKTQHEEKIINMLHKLFTTDTTDSNDERRLTEAETPPPPPPKKPKSFMQSFMDKVKEIEEATPPTLTGPLAEFQRYMGMKSLDMKEDPLLWWQEHSPMFPHLSIIARKYIFIPATSVPSDRLFSKAGELVSKRNCHSESTVDMVLFLNKLQKVNQNQTKQNCRQKSLNELETNENKTEFFVVKLEK